MANGKKTWSETYGDKSATLTPLEWEQKTGNKLLSYSTYNGKLSMDMPMKFQAQPGYDRDAYKQRQQSIIEQNMQKLGFTEKSITPQGQTMYTKPSSNQPSGAQQSDMLLQSAYNQIMDRASGGSSGLYQEGQRGLSKGGFYGSMAALEAASMRLADAALGRELISTQQKGQQEKSLSALRGTQEYGLAGLRGTQESKLISQRAEEERRSEIEREIRQLEKERSEVGSMPYSVGNRALYNNLNNQIQNLRNQIR